MSEYEYQSGFGNEFASEDRKFSNSLPRGQNNPQVGKNSIFCQNQTLFILESWIQPVHRTDQWFLLHLSSTWELQIVALQNSALCLPWTVSELQVRQLRFSFWFLIGTYLWSGTRDWWLTGPPSLPTQIACYGDHSHYRDLRTKLTGWTGWRLWLELESRDWDMGWGSISTSVTPAWTRGRCTTLTGTSWLSPSLGRSISRRSLEGDNLFPWVIIINWTLICL